MHGLVFAIPFLAQAAAMSVDEVHFHRRRGLSRWERIGHPLDTVTVAACFAFALLVPPSHVAAPIFVGLALASCLFVTKDERVHATSCTAAEHWLHAVLFVLHPIVLATVGLLWPALWLRHAPAWIDDAASARALFFAAFALTVLFGAYQALYWNVPWRRRRA